jgi:hypothetical protein
MLGVLLPKRLESEQKSSSFAVDLLSSIGRNNFWDRGAITMQIHNKTTLCMIVLLLFVMSILYMLNVFKFQAAFMDLTADRVRALSAAIHGPIEASGRRFGSVGVQGMRGIVSRIRENNPMVESIHLFDVHGKNLYSSPEEAIGPIDFPFVLGMLESTDIRSYQTELDGDILSAFSILDDSKHMIGLGVVLFSKKDHNRRVAHFNRTLAWKYSIIFLVFSVISSVWISFALRGLSRYLKSIASSHDRIRRSEAAGENVCFIDTEGLPGDVSGHAMIRLENFDSRLCDIERNAADAMAALETLHVKASDPDISKENMTIPVYDNGQQERLASRLVRPLLVIMTGTLCCSCFVFAYVGFAESSSSLHLESPVYIYPDIDGGDVAGVVKTGIDERFASARIDNVIYDNFVIFVVAVLMASQIMTAMFMCYITGPIERLNTLINLQVAGNFSKYSKDCGTDAVGRVARHLSRTAEKIQVRFAERRRQFQAFSKTVPNPVDAVGRYYGLVGADPSSPIERASGISGCRFSFLPLPRSFKSPSCQYSYDSCMPHVRG